MRSWPIPRDVAAGPDELAAVLRERFGPVAPLIAERYGLTPQASNAIVEARRRAEVIGLQEEIARVRQLADDSARECRRLAGLLRLNAVFLERMSQIDEEDFDRHRIGALREQAAFLMRRLKSPGR